MLQAVKNNFAKLSNYPRLRILLIIVAVVIIFVIVMNLLTPSSMKESAPPSKVQSVTAGGSNQKAAPGNQVSQYQQLSSTAQATAEQNAIQSGGSVFQNAVTPNASNADTGKIAPITPQQFATDKPNTDSAASTQNPQLSDQVANLQQQLAAQQAAQQKAQQNQQAMSEQMQGIQSAMRSGIQNISGSWQLPSLATVQGEQPQSPNGGSSGSSAQGPVAIKAGTILFGVIMTALDSDQPGTPVLATIVTGPYKGAKLMGGFVAENNALVVQFNLMTIDSLPSSIPISAYAIDEQTANNAIASDVDNHYLLRYGMLFASAFLQGFGTAYQNYTYCPPGTQNCSVINTNGSSNLPSNNVTATTAMYQGLGQVGTTLGQVAAQQFNTPPTITVNQGTGIGVLFNTDVRIPLNQ